MSCVGEDSQAPPRTSTETEAGHATSGSTTSSETHWSTVHIMVKTVYLYNFFFPTN